MPLFGFFSEITQTNRLTDRQLRCTKRYAVLPGIGLHNN